MYSHSSDYETKIMPSLLPAPQAILNWYAANNNVDPDTLKNWENDARNPESWISKEITKATIHLIGMHELLQVMHLQDQNAIILKAREAEAKFDEVYENKKQPIEAVTKLQDSQQLEQAEKKENKPTSVIVTQKKKAVDDAETEVMTATEIVKNAWEQAAAAQQTELSAELAAEIKKQMENNPNDKARMAALLECKEFVETKPKPRAEVEKVYAASLNTFNNLREYEKSKWQKIDSVPYAPPAPALSAMLQTPIAATTKLDSVTKVQLNLREALMNELLMKFKADRVRKLVNVQPTAGQTQTAGANKDQETPAKKSLQTAQTSLTALTEKRTQLLQAKEDYVKTVQAETAAAEQSRKAAAVAAETAAKTPEPTPTTKGPAPGG